MFVWLRLLIASGLTFAAAYGVTSWVLGPAAPPTQDPAPRAGPEKPSQAPEASAPEPEVVDTSIGTTRFVKLDGTGAVLPDTAGTWACVRDNLFNLVWEVKQSDGSMRDLDFTYTWLSEAAGAANGGQCFHIDCDTGSLAAAVNQAGLCGWRDWRLPTNLELMTLFTDIPTAQPGVDRRYFPNSKAGSYWSATVSGDGITAAWSVNFGNGFPEITEMSRPHFVRLVRAEPES